MSNQDKLTFEEAEKYLGAYKELIDSMSRVYQQQENYKVEIANLKNEVERILNNIEKLQELYRELKNANDNLNANTISRARKDIDTIFSNLERVEQKIQDVATDLNNSIEKAELRINELEQKVASITTIHDVYTAQKTFEEKMWQMYNKLSTETASLSTDIKAAKDRINLLADEINAMKKITFKNKKQAVIILSTLTGSGSIIYLIVQYLLRHLFGG